MWIRAFLSRFRVREFRMMTSEDCIQRLESRALQAENVISALKAEVLELQKAAEFCQHNLQSINYKKYEEMKVENEKLKREIEQWKTRLIEAEKKMGMDPLQINFSQNGSKIEKQGMDLMPEESEKVEQIDEKKKKDKNKIALQEEKKGNKKGAASEEDNVLVDVSRLDLRIGKIISVKKHPDADSLYVEEVDFGEGKPRTVVSGLVKFVPIEEMKNKMVVGLCNLKPAKMRGVVSEAMVLCASTPEKVEILMPPEGSCPGDKITVEGFVGNPDSVLNPKKKVFETVAPDLKTDSQKIATYKGVPFTVPGKGVVTTESLINVQIK